MDILRRHVFKNILNCRDIGGYPTENGSTKFGRFIRCGIVKTPEDWEIEKLAELNVKTVIDLRGIYESELTPLHLDRIPDADVYNLPLYEFNVATKEGMDLPLDKIYDMIINTQQEHILKVLRTIAEAKDGVIMYNCFFGKDRTGILTMLLLSIAGVSENDIIADYQQTYTYVKNYIKANADILWDKNSEKHFSLPETIENVIDMINQKYGSVLSYIKSLGLSDEEIQSIKNKLC